MFGHEFGTAVIEDALAWGTAVPRASELSTSKNTSERVVCRFQTLRALACIAEPRIRVCVAVHVRTTCTFAIVSYVSTRNPSCGRAACHAPPCQWLTWAKNVKPTHLLGEGGLTNISAVIYRHRS